MNNNDPRARRRIPRRYLILAAIFLAALIGWDVVAELQSEEFDWGAVRGWMVTIGSVGFVATMLAMLLDRWHTDSITNLVEASLEQISADFSERSASIARDVFDAVFASGVHKDMYKQFRDEVLNCPVYRSNFEISMNLEIAQVEVNGEPLDVLLCKTRYEYQLVSLHEPATVAAVRAAVLTNEFPGFEENCTVEKVIIGTETIEGADLQLRLNDEGFRYFNREYRVPYGQPLAVAIETVVYKRMADSEIIEFMQPTTGIEFFLHLHDCDLNIRHRMMSKIPPREGLNHNPGQGRHHWVMDSGMLPHQGIVISWTP